jgi:lysyl-tRNA synthetase class 1
MLWFAELAAAIDAGKAQVVNDSKTPSGRVHVGALRGVIMHDAVYRALKSRGVAVKYMFGVDDYDPVDEIPAGQGEHFERYRGAPLCNVPAPQGSSAPDMAEHFIGEFFQIFKELGVDAEHYRMRDVYRSGRFDEPIEAILSRAADVRRIYKEVSGSVRPETWFPFQVVCEVCGRIGTTEVSAFDGKEVTYDCRPKLVKWAQGCGHHGKMSPFGGKGKLPWKLEWAAKWRVFGVTIEGAGKDHTTKGGARDVSNACFRAIFGGEPPRNIPYEFFLVGGAKMSSSKGIGASAREVADFLPPEVLRYLILRTQPKTTVQFSLTEEFLVKLFNDKDRLHHRVFHDDKVKDDEKELHALCEITGVEGDTFDANLQLVLTFVQMPGVDLVAELEKRKGAKLTELERAHLARRVTAAKTYLERYATEDERIVLQQALPASAAELTHAQRGFAHLYASEIDDVAWEDDALQAKVFDVARRTPIEQPLAFKAIYRLFLDKEQGPRAGALFSVLERDFVKKRLTEVALDEAAFARETSIDHDKMYGFIEQYAASQSVIHARAREFDGEWTVEVQFDTGGKAFIQRTRALDAPTAQRDATKWQAQAERTLRAQLKPNPLG